MIGYDEIDIEEYKIDPDNFDIDDKIHDHNPDEVKINHVIDNMDEEENDVMDNIVENVNEVDENNVHGVNNVIDNMDEEGNDVMNNIYW